MSDLDAFALCHRFIDELCELRPVEATFMGIPGHDHRWGDRSPDGHAEVAALWRRLVVDVDALPATEDRWQGLSRRVVRDAAAIELERFDHGEHLRDLAHIAAFSETVVGEWLDVMDLTSEAGWTAAASRLERYDELLAGYQASVDEGVRTGVVAARRQVESVIEQLRACVEPDGRLGRLPEELSRAGIEHTPGLSTRIADATEQACQAVAHLALHLERHVLPAANPHDGVGRERYLVEAHRHLGMELDPEETYAWGWHHLGELLAEARRVAARIDPEASLEGLVAMLKTDPSYAAGSQDEFRERMLERQEQALADLDGTHFDVPDPVRTIEVRLAAPSQPPGAWYHPPSEDWSRPGSLWWSFGERERIPLFEEVSTSYHEGFPGHHLQVGIQVALHDRLSRLHRLLYWNPGYGEGWALYAERLMVELGYLEESEYHLGQLSGAILRALRVVVDIGTHLDLPIPDDAPFRPGERWSYEVGVEALRTIAFLDADYATSEMKRYLGWPAQAISYKVGERVILELRDEVRSREGDAYDPKDFHERVLGSGPVGLDLLSELVRNPG